MNEKSNRGFTLVELLVVIAIIGVLISMTLPALMASRETGRRNMCRANMAQIALALQNYENAFEMFPAGVVNPDGPVRNEAKGLDQGWLIPVLPYLDEQNVYEHIDQSQSVYAPENAAARDYWPPVLICPSESNDVPGTSSYAGCHHDVEAPIAADNAGMLFLNSHIRREDVTDGLAHTILIGEKRTHPGDLGWMSGTRATLRNTGLSPNAQSEREGLPVAVVASADKAPADEAADEAMDTTKGKAADEAKDEAAADAALLYVGGFASGHPSGAHVGFADGSVEFISEDIDQKLWQRLGNRADGQLTNLRSTAP